MSGYNTELNITACASLQYKFCVDFGWMVERYQTLNDTHDKKLQYHYAS